jgi:carboxypeptidase Taq
MKRKLQVLLEKLRVVYDLQAAAKLLYWDQATYMPEGGEKARAKQLATLRRLAHEHLTAPEVRDLLGELRDGAWPMESEEAKMIGAACREHDRAVRVPGALVAEIAAHTTTTYAAWTRARPANDFAAVRPLLERTVELARATAACFPYDHVADPLIDEEDPGMSAQAVRALFATLRRDLVPLVQELTAKPPADDACLRQRVPEATQLAFGAEVIERFGYDFARGRQDKTHHPFMTSFSTGDVRITTRLRDDDLTDCLFSTLHEAGHALYEQGIDPNHEATPLAGGVSAGVHESQSRLWENLVGRSLPFWEHFYPKLQQSFGGALSTVPLETFYRAVNRVSRSLIRTDADEVTYNLHVVLRFELELALLEGTLAVADLPEAWNARMQADLGIRPTDDRHGVLQDVHWFGGLVGGAFQGYTIGNLLAAQLFEAAVTAEPTIVEDMRQGTFLALRTWLGQHVHGHGRKFLPKDLIVRATGRPLSTEPFLRYLRRKYSDLD